MKKKIAKKLILPKETIRALRDGELEEAAGAAVTNLGCSCGNPRSTCPI